MRRKLVAGNWKMHGNRQSISALIAALKEPLQRLQCESDTLDIAVFPPAIFLETVKSLLAGSRIKIGAQNVNAEAEGAFTGEISASMLADFELDYVIVGHSERRQLFAETDQQVADKFVAAQRNNLVPILCLGETLSQREAGAIEKVVLGQLDAVIATVGVKAIANCVIAYEPVWAIGTGKTASPQQAQEVHRAIRRRLTSHDSELADKMSIIYGGSVNAGNADDLFAQQDIDGGLVGGASLKAEEFISICKSVD